ncbi:MAG TPA: glycosyltransferase family 2 protein [Sporosarcina sp.]|nr:glycosyltransferase family 2 protein [Sporosarcina sp.]
MSKLTISFIIPAYNEGENLIRMVKAIHQQMTPLLYPYEMLFIDDGSTDHSVQILEELAAEHTTVKYVTFTRNFGKEAAIFAGLQNAIGDAVILMDADLQHPPTLIEKLLEGFEEGYDQVVAKRDRKGDSAFRTILTKLYYRFVNNAIDVQLCDGEGDFRLLSRKAVNALLKLSEGNRFSKGLYSWIGLDRKVITYENQIRENGKSKWTFSKLLNYGIDGIISFNNKPLRICFHTGFLILLLSLVYISITFIQVIKHGITVPGYFTTISAILFIGGVQLVCLGIIGEYIGRIYYETKRRPHYLVKQTNIEIEEEKSTIHEMV